MARATHASAAGRTYAARRTASRGAYGADNVPACSVAPAITGTTTEGQTLTCSSGTWSRTPDAYAYQWNRGVNAITGATAATRVLATADVGSTMTCTVSATNLGVSAVATSAATAAIAAA